MLRCNPICLVTDGPMQNFRTLVKPLLGKKKPDEKREEEEEERERNSASAGGRRSWVCARLTLRSAPHQH